MIRRAGQKRTHGACKFIRYRASSGFAMADMVGALFLVSSVMGLAVLLLHRGYAIHHRAIDQVQRQQALLNAHQRWRSDVHEGVVSINDQRLSVSLPSKLVVRYRMQDENLLREMMDAEGQVVGNETWLLGGIDTCVAEVRESDTPRSALVHFRLANSAGGSPADEILWVACSQRQQSAIEMVEEPPEAEGEVSDEN